MTRSSHGASGNDGSGGADAVAIGAGAGGLGGQTGSSVTATPLLSADGSIEGAGADGQIWGFWFTWGGDVPAEGDPVQAIDGEIRFSGATRIVDSLLPLNIFSAAIGFTLCSMPAEITPCPAELPAEYCDWEPESPHTIEECGIGLNTISFDITGTLPSTELRLTFEEQNREENAYLVVESEGRFEGDVLDAAVSWTDDAPPFVLDRVEAIYFEVTPTNTGPVEFDFCISNLQID